MVESKPRVVIIGGGPGGYVAAIRASQLGAQVSLIEKDKLGGTCLHRGCVPAKFLIQATSLLSRIKTASRFGISTGTVSVDTTKMHLEKQAIIDRLKSGIEYLMENNRVRVYKGTGSILSPRKVKIDGEAESLIEADKIIIATGSEPALLPVEGAKEGGAITSDEALELKSYPGSLVIIGGGVIGVEFAQIFQRMNTKVTIIELLPHILPNEDKDITDILEEELRQNGIDIYCGARVVSIKSGEAGRRTVTMDTGDNRKEVAAEAVLMAVGRLPFTDNLGLTNLGIATGKNGKITVNSYLETSVPGIYAIGDVQGSSMLAHVAMAEGICAAESAMGKRNVMDYKVVPRCIYSEPEVAAVGLTEAEARARYWEANTGSFPFSASSKAIITGETAGMVKIVAEPRYNQVVGVSIIGPRATELIAEAALGIRLEATLEEIASTIHAHPTFSEAVAESALNAEGRGIHF